MSPDTPRIQPDGSTPRASRNTSAAYEQRANTYDPTQPCEAPREKRNALRRSKGHGPPPLRHPIDQGNMLAFPPTTPRPEYEVVSAYENELDTDIERNVTDAIAVHAVKTRRQIADLTRSLIGDHTGLTVSSARWLLGEHRRSGKHSSIVLHPSRPTEYGIRLDRRRLRSRSIQVTLRPTNQFLDTITNPPGSPRQHQDMGRSHGTGQRKTQQAPERHDTLRGGSGTHSC